MPPHLVSIVQPCEIYFMLTGDALLADPEAKHVGNADDGVGWFVAVPALMQPAPLREFEIPVKIPIKIPGT